MSNFKYKKSIMFFSLFVKNFPPGTTEEEIRIYFSSACNGGEVTKVTVIPGTQQAFVNFEKQDCCKAAKEFARNVLFKSQYALYAEYCYPKEMRMLRNEDILDKKAMEKRKAQQNQAQLASLNGSQNLIDLLTMLLKPHIQMYTPNSNQRRSHSVNTATSRGGQMAAGGLNQQMMQGQYYRNASRGPQMGPRSNMQRQMQGPPMMQMMPMPHPMMNQSMVSGGASSVASSTVPINVSAAYANGYQQEIQQMFTSAQFKNSESNDKKEMVGNTIYKHVEKIVGETKAPKITGMLIDLPEAELNFSISNWNNLFNKVQSAFALITENENRAPAAAGAHPADVKV